MIGEGDALLGRSKGPLEAITIIGSSFIIYHSPLHHRMRFHPCTGYQSAESYRPVTSAPTHFLIRTHTWHRLEHVTPPVHRALS